MTSQPAAEEPLELDDCGNSYQPQKWAVMTRGESRMICSVTEFRGDYIITSSGTFRKLDDPAKQIWRHVSFPQWQIVFIGTKQEAKDFKDAI